MPGKRLEIRKDTPMKKRKYRKPPIVEVVCEFRFKSTTQWDATIPGLIFERVKKDFPRRRAIRNVGMHVQVEGEGLLFQSQMEEGTQFLRKDERAFVQVHPRRISVHHFAPYPHWEGFKPLIKKVFQAYQNVITESQLQRIGLRYINKIDFNSSEVELQNFLTIYPHVGTELPQKFSAFTFQLLFPYEDERDGLQLRLSNAQPAKENTLSILLDLDYFLMQPDRQKNLKALNWVEKAHNNILAAFEGSITDALRQQFEEEEEK